MTKSELRNEMARRIQESHNSRSATFMSQREARRLAQAAIPAVDEYVADRDHRIDAAYNRTGKGS